MQQVFHYFDSSVLLRYAIDHQLALRDLEAYSEDAVTSAITRVECMRVLDRWRLTREVDDEKLALARSTCLKMLGGLVTIEVDANIIEAASQTFPIAMKSLDAIHLASALLLKRQAGRPVHVLTHDLKMSLACQALDLVVVV